MVIWILGRLSVAIEGDEVEIHDVDDEVELLGVAPLLVLVDLTHDDITGCLGSV